MNEREILNVLDHAVPRLNDGRGDWEAVLAEVRRGRRPRLWVRAAAVAAVGVAVAGAVLLWPSSPHRGVLDRALAAVGDGPVLHLVLREGWGNALTLVDLRTGERRPLGAEREVWYDPQRGLHEIDRVGGVVQSDELYAPGKLPSNRIRILGGAAAEYRQALDSGRAELGGAGEVDGIPVYWIKVTAEMLPFAPDGKLHEWAQQVAVSRETYEPIATRETRDGVTGPDGITRILRLEMAESGSGSFTRLTPDLSGVAMRLGAAEELTPAQAKGVLGRPALWAGQEVRGLALTRIAKLEAGVGDRTYTGVVLEYGPGREPSPTGAPYVRLTEATSLFEGFQRGVRAYVPAEGTLLLVGSANATLRQDGLYVSISSTSEELVLAAARALRPADVR